MKQDHYLRGSTKPFVITYTRNWNWEVTLGLRTHAVVGSAAAWLGGGGGGWRIQYEILQAWPVAAVGRRVDCKIASVQHVGGG